MQSLRWQFLAGIEMITMEIKFPAAAFVAAAGTALLIVTAGCASKSDDVRSANAPAVNTSAPLPANLPKNAPPAVSAAIQASQAQGQAMASKAAADGAAAAAAQAAASRR
jgi:hypothetical protein